MDSTRMNLERLDAFLSLYAFLLLVFTSLFLRDIYLWGLAARY
jgi:hypothetical protein